MGCDPHTRVLDLEHEPGRLIGLCQHVGPHDDASGIGELDRIAQQVHEHLTQLALVGHDAVRNVRGALDHQQESLLCATMAEHRLEVGEQGAQIERRGIQDAASRLDLGHLQHVVEQSQQMLATSVDDPKLLMLRRAQGFVAREELREAQDGVHRGPNLVAHVGQELRLGLRRALKCLVGTLQFDVESVGRFEESQVLDSSGHHVRHSMQHDAQ